MICPYCKKEINVSNDFCPACGQSISPVGSGRTKVEARLNENHNGPDRLIQYQDLIDKQARDSKVASKRKHRFYIVVILLVGATVFGAYKYLTYSTYMVSQVHAALVGQTLEATRHHTDLRFTTHHEHWYLTFVNESALEYHYTDNDRSKTDGEFNYTLTRSLIGKYKINTNGEVFELTVEGSVPKSLKIQ